jgi:hypothetical protein
MMPMDTTAGDAYASQIIDDLGGTKATAELFGIESAAVSQWRRNGIPKPRMQYLRLARPELFLTSEEESKKVVA